MVRRASGGSRTHNPRITNAVLCRLKLRWRWKNLAVASSGLQNPPVEKKNRMPHVRERILTLPAHFDNPDAMTGNPPAEGSVANWAENPGIFPTSCLQSAGVNV